MTSKWFYTGLTLFTIGVLGFFVCLLASVFISPAWEVGLSLWAIAPLGFLFMLIDAVLSRVRASNYEERTSP